MGLTDPSPLPFIFTADGSFRPATPFAAELCVRRYAAGAKYLLVEHQERSLLSHNQQFAWIDEAWRQLPEKLADLYPTPEHLRKRALIEAGFYHEEAIDCGTKAAALRVAAYLRKHDDFAHLILRGPIATWSAPPRANPTGRWTARSSRPRNRRSSRSSPP